MVVFNFQVESWLQLEFVLVEVRQDDILGLTKSVCQLIEAGSVAILSTIQDNKPVQSIGQHIKIFLVLK